MCVVWNMGFCQSLNKKKKLGRELKVLLKLKSLIRFYFTDLKYWKSNSNSRETYGKIARPQEVLNYYSNLITFNRFEKIKIGKKKVSRPVSRWIKIYLTLICCDTMSCLCAWGHSATLMALWRSTHKNIRCITCFIKHTRRKLLLVSKSALLMSKAFYG